MAIEPGRAITSTPTKPSATASQRHGPIFSFSIKAESTTANIGVVKPSTVATASGSRIVAPKLASMPNMPISERVAWLLRRVVRSCHHCPRNATQA
jgi:hypothetical protein